MRFDVYGRFQLEVLRESEAWVAYRVGVGTRTHEGGIVIPPELAADEIAGYLDDLFHELSGPGGASARPRGLTRLPDMDDPAELSFRAATRDDVPGIVRMLADDPLGATREAYAVPLPERYYATFDAISRDPNNELVVAVLEGRVVGVLQLTVIPYLTYRGGWRATIEGVRVDASLRSGGMGRKLFEWAIERARARGCHLVQLTSDKARPDAIRFYEGLGFVASHEGMKLHL